MGSSARREIEAGVYRESGLLSAGYIMGIIGTILLIVPIVLVVIWLVFALGIAGLRMA